MKKIFSGAVLACSLLLTAADPYFNTAIKGVDTGGEMLSYRNLTATTAFIENELPEIIIRQVAAVGKSQVTPQITNALRERLSLIFKALDLASVKAVAASSVKISPNLFVSKNALVIDPASKSILLNKNAVNKPLDYMSLPADTRLALAGEIDFGNAWQQIKQLISASSDPETQNILVLAGNLKQQGIDLDAIFAALTGRFSLLLAGDDMFSMRFKLEIPDKNGALSALLKCFLPPKPGSNQVTLPLPMPTGVPPVMIYAEKALILASGGNVLTQPEQTLAALPEFREFARHLPLQGCSYMVCNIPQGATDTLDMLFSLNPEMPKLNIQPFAFISVGSKTAYGFSDVVVSDFSFAQLETTYIKSMIPIIFDLQTKKLMNAQRR